MLKKCGLAKNSSRKKLTNNDNIKLETALQELVLDLLCDGVETDVGLSPDFCGHYSIGCWVRE